MISGELEDGEVWVQPGLTEEEYVDPSVPSKLRPHKRIPGFSSELFQNLNEACRFFKFFIF